MYHNTVSLPWRPFSKGERNDKVFFFVSQTAASLSKTAQAAARSHKSGTSGKEDENKKLIDMLQATLQELKHNGKWR